MIWPSIADLVGEWFPLRRNPYLPPPPVPRWAEHKAFVEYDPRTGRHVKRDATFWLGAEGDSHGT